MPVLKGRIVWLVRAQQSWQESLDSEKWVFWVMGSFRDNEPIFSAYEEIGLPRTMSLKPKGSLTSERIGSERRDNHLVAPFRQ